MCFLLQYFSIPNEVQSVNISISWVKAFFAILIRAKNTITLKQISTSIIVCKTCYYYRRFYILKT